MAVNPNIIAYLDEQGVKYEAVSHPQVFSTVEEANALGIEADEVAKTLVINIRGRYVLAILPGAQRLDVKKLREVLNTSHARLMTEEEMANDFPEYDVGAVPPLGALFNIPVYVDKKLLDHETIIFAGGTHTDSIKMKTKDLVDLIKPQLVDLAKEKTFEATAW